MLAIILIVFVPQLSVVYLLLQVSFETTPLRLVDLLIAFGVGLIVSAVVELEKKLRK